MSSNPSPIDRCVFVRIVARATGWSHTVLTSLTEYKWLWLQTDQHGLQGVAPIGDHNWAVQVGSWTQSLPEADIELRENVTVIDVPLERVEATVQTNPRRVIGVFLDQDAAHIVVDAAGM